MGKVIQSYCCQQIQITLPQVYNLLLNTQKPLNRTWLQISKDFKLLILIYQMILYIHALGLGQCYTLTS